MTASNLSKVTRHGQVTLPAAVRRALRIEEGDLIEVKVSGDDIILSPKKLIDKSQAYFWSASWQSAEKEADDDIAAGRTQGFENVDAAINALRKARGEEG
jgi:AbrB family looped-hinge helix DNA binding protein